MESGQNPYSESENEHQYLFDQLDDIVAAANNEELAEEIDEIERKQVQYDRQLSIIDELSELVEPQLAKALEKLYESEDGTRVLAEDVGDTLVDMLGEQEKGTDNHELLLYLNGLNDIVWLASLVMKQDGVYKPIYPKSEIQIEILEENSFDPALKRELLDFVDTIMPGEPLDMTDPDMVFEALTERKERADIATEMAILRVVVEDEFSRFGHTSEDPEYAMLVGMIGGLIRSHYDAKFIVMFMGDSRTLRLLGISPTEFADSVVAIFDRFNTLD